MKKSAFKLFRDALTLLAAAFLFVPPASSQVLPSGGDYQVAASVIDNGGGEKMTGGAYAAKGSIAQNSLPAARNFSSGGDYASRTGFYNPPHFTYQRGLPSSLTMASGEIQVSLPADSVNGKEVFDITLNKDPVYKPVAVDPYKILNATEKMVYNDGEWAQLYSNNLSEMAIFDEQGFSTSLAKRGVMNIRYKDANNDGVLDGSNPPVRVNTLSTWILDESVDSWVRMPGSGADAGSKTLTVYFGLPGVYAVLGAQDQSVVNVKAYPVPFRPNGPQAGTGQGQTGSETGGITFDNVPQGGNISIYTLDGRLVKKIEIPEVLSIQTMNWNVRTASGERVASGVYIWRVVSGSNSKTGKLMVIW